MNSALAKIEFTRAVFERLARSRRRQPNPKSPWGDDWENFLEDAAILAAEDRAEALRVARGLQCDGWLELRFLRDGERPRRLVVPLAKERGWFAAFNQTHPADIPNDRAEFSRIVWESALSFIASMRVGVPLVDLLKLQEFFANSGRERPLMPVKERSLQIFGDEKRLDELRTSSLFDDDRLTLDTLRCFVVAEPLGWQRGPAANNNPVLVIENAATWHSYCQWNRERGLFGAVVYGGGNRFMDSVSFLSEIFRELGGSRRVLYFGDLDPPGLRIPRRASASALKQGLPPVEPEFWSYRQLLTLGRGKETAWEGNEPGEPADCEWLGELAEAVSVLLMPGKRLAQEHVNWEFLRRQTTAP